MPLITEISDYERAVSFLNEDDSTVAWDLETTGIDWRGNYLVGVGLKARDQSFYMSFRHREGPNLPEKKIQELWERVLHPRRKQLFFHGSYDLKVAAHHDGYELPEPGFFGDSLLAALLMNENEDSFKMEALAQKYVDKNAGVQEERLLEYLADRFGGSIKEAKGHLWKAPAKLVAPYGEQDVWTTARLLEFYLPHLETWKLLDLYHEVCDFQVEVAKIELRGVLIDRENVPNLKMEAEIRARELLVKIQEAAGYRINPGSPKQVCAWFGLKSSKRAVLQRLKREEAAWVLEWRKWSKAVSTYYNPYLAFMDKEGVLRANLHITSPGVKSKGKWNSRNGTISGRLSSSKPNLQQIPRGSESYRVKELFIARPGRTLAELDYSQAELRVAAHYSKDERLTQLLLAGEDMHSTVAREMNVPRHIAKNMNFSAWYGIGPRTFARNYFIPEREARDYLSRYHKMFPGIRRLYNACEARATHRGYIKLYTGRLRHYNCIESPAHKASNNLIQGSVAEMVRVAMLRCAKEVPEAPMVLQVHDSIWFEIPTEIFLPTVAKLRAIMQDQPQFSLPMIVDAKGGPGFKDARDLPRDTAGIPAAALAHCTDPTLVHAA